jgi:hypothetical protein
LPLFISLILISSFWYTKESNMHSEHFPDNLVVPKEETRPQDASLEEQLRALRESGVPIHSSHIAETEGTATSIETKRTQSYPPENLPVIEEKSESREGSGEVRLSREKDGTFEVRGYEEISTEIFVSEIAELRERFGERRALLAELLLHQAEVINEKAKAQYVEALSLRDRTLLYPERAGEFYGELKKAQRLEAQYATEQEVFLTMLGTFLREGRLVPYGTPTLKHAGAERVMAEFEEERIRRHGAWTVALQPIEKEDSVHGVLGEVYDQNPEIAERYFGKGKIKKKEREKYIEEDVLARALLRYGKESVSADEEDLQELGRKALAIWEEKYGRKTPQMESVDDRARFVACLTKRERGIFEDALQEKIAEGATVRFDARGHYEIDVIKLDARKEKGDEAMHVETLFGHVAGQKEIDEGLEGNPFRGYEWKALLVRGHLVEGLVLTNLFGEYGGSGKGKKYQKIIGINKPDRNGALSGEIDAIVCYAKEGGVRNFARAKGQSKQAFYEMVSGELEREREEEAEEQE